MTITTNPNVRFLNNQFINAVSSYSSQQTALPASNVYDPSRSRIWQPTGFFRIDATNNKVYVDGATGTIANGDYSSPDALVPFIQAACNSASSGWTITYEASYKFKFSRSTAGVVNLTSTTNAIWNLIGFTDITNQTAPYTGAEQRNHQYEYLIFDMGYSAAIEAFCAVGPIDEVFNFSSSATIKLQANTINDWTSPPLDLTLVKSDYGIFRFMDDITSTYRYWRFYFEDKLNPDGPTAFNIGNIYLGDYISLTTRNFQNGFNYTINDPSDKFQSENGVVYFNLNPKYFEFDGCEIIAIENSDKRIFERMFQQLGMTTPFYISIDPRLQTTQYLYETTKYVLFSKPPQFRHIVANLYSVSMGFRELV